MLPDARCSFQAVFSLVSSLNIPKRRKRTVVWCFFNWRKHLNTKIIWWKLLGKYQKTVGKRTWSQEWGDSFLPHSPCNYLVYTVISFKGKGKQKLFSPIKKKVIIKVMHTHCKKMQTGIKWKFKASPSTFIYF